jgi:RNA 2',3'-cyclic 3'-phosphodiesterase
VGKIMSEKTHYFLALRLPDPIKNSLAEARRKLQEGFHFQRWVHEQDYHITLAFLGYANEQQLRDVREFLPNYIKNDSTFSLSISHIGTFGMKEAPRIFWAGIDKSQELQALRNHTYSACEQAGFQLEKRSFHPHITLARKWKGNEPFDMLFLDKENLFWEQPLTFKATEVVLYKTNLLQTPKYETVFTFSLQSK